MKQWITSFIKGPDAWNPKARFVGKIAYYYLILMGLFLLYVVQRQHTPAPFIYSNF